MQEIEKVSGKNFKIWGIGYGLLGDIIMSLPLFTYFEKKYPDSYKFLVIEKKCSICAPLFFNHPLIDKIKITNKWSGVGEEDIEIAKSCHLRDQFWERKNTQWHDDPRWYNKRSCVEETARIYGIKDLLEVLNEDELYPKLYRWFDVGRTGNTSNTYSRSNNDTDLSVGDIAVWPFASSNHPKRSPSVNWWKSLIDMLGNEGLTISHYGRNVEPVLTDHPNYQKETFYSFFDQVKMALASKVVIGPDTGSMWIMGAYSHPAVNLVTNFLSGHNKNLLALNPINKNAAVFFEKNGCDNISIEKVAKAIRGKI